MIIWNETVSLHAMTYDETRGWLKELNKIHINNNWRLPTLSEWIQDFDKLKLNSVWIWVKDIVPWRVNSQGGYGYELNVEAKHYVIAVRDINEKK